ncbi:MAG TPA: helix-turn-helix domain-containing protein [Vineibacter sp.]|nr:helix-turn-helix domain-containing protein [Vineibacter sp.]
MRTRTRTRPAIAPSARHDQQAGDCDADAASDAIVPELVTGDDVPADEARLREVVRMGLSGMTQDQIAGRFHVTARTIRRWQVHARQKRLDRFRATTPDDMLSSMLDRLAMIEAEAITMQDAAIAAGSMKIAIEALRQRRAVIRDTSLIGERVGLFENFKFVPPASDDPAAMLADQMRQGIGELLALFAPGTAPADVATDTLDTAPADAPMPDTA